MACCLAQDMVATMLTSALTRTEATRIRRKASTIHVPSVSVTDQTKNWLEAPPSYYRR